jgi:hypothetical protein
MATVKYTRVEEYLKSLTGITDPTTDEKAWWKSAFNRRVRMAYEASRLWPRYTKEESRYSGFDNVIPTEQVGKDEIDTFHGIWDVNPRNKSSVPTKYDWIVTQDGAKVLGQSDADYQDVVLNITGDTAATGVAGSISTADSNVAYAMSFWFKADSPVVTGTPNTSRNVFLINNNGDGLTTGNSSASLNIGIQGAASVVTSFEFKNSWIETDGTSMTVFIDGINIGTDFGVGDVGVELKSYLDGEWHHAIWTLPPSATTANLVSDFVYANSENNDTGITYDIDFADVRVYNQKIDAATAQSLFANPEELSGNIIWSSSAPEYFVSFKEALNTTYGQGSGESDDIPLEFFEYGYHGAYADWLRAEGQTDKARVEEMFANEHLERQLEKISYTNGSPYLWQTFSTHSSRQNR